MHARVYALLPVVLGQLDGGDKKARAVVVASMRKRLREFAAEFMRLNQNTSVPIAVRERVRQLAAEA